MFTIVYCCVLYSVHCTGACAAPQTHGGQDTELCVQCTVDFVVYCALLCVLVLYMCLCRTPATRRTRSSMMCTVYCCVLCTVVYCVLLCTVYSCVLFRCFCRTPATRRTRSSTMCTVYCGISYFFVFYSVKDKHSNRKGTQITLHLSRAGIDLATYGLQEKHLDLSPREVRCFS